MEPALWTCPRCYWENGPRRARSTSQVLAEGVRVEAHGLSNAAHLNGEQGVIRSRHGDRWVVEFDKTREEKALKPDNLRAMPAEVGRVCDSIKIDISMPIR